MKKKIMIASAVILVVVFLIVAIKNINNTPVSKDVLGPADGINVSVDEVTTEKIVNTTEATGEIEIIEKINIYSTSSGKIESVNFDVGDEVKKGDILVTYDESTLESLQEELRLAKLDLRSGQLVIDSITLPPEQEQLLQLEAQVRARADELEMSKKQMEQLDLNIASMNDQLATAQENLNDSKTLLDNGIISKKDYNIALDSVKSLENNIESLSLDKENATNGINSVQLAYNDTETQLNLLKNKNSSPQILNQLEQQKVSLEKLKIRVESLEENIAEFEQNLVAEESGVVISKNVEKGTNVQKGVTLYTIANTERENLIVKLNVLEYDSYAIDLNQKVTLDSDSFGNEEVNGTVVKISPTVEEKMIGTAAKKVVGVDVAIEDGNVPIRAGSGVDATITTSINEEATVVPLLSVFNEDNDDFYIYVVNKDFEVEKRNVKLGSYIGTSIEVDNIEVGEVVVVDPPEILEDGSKVKYTEVLSDEN